MHSAVRKEFAGKLRKRVLIESVDESGRAPGGEPLSVWSTYATIWAGIRPLSGRELFLAQQRVAEATHAVTLRFLDGLTPKMRLNLNGRIFNILSVVNVDEQGREMDLLCREIV